jgi:hypothetical protein
MDQGKLFKEFQRCLGGTIVEPTESKVWNAVVFDMDDFCSHVTKQTIKNAGDGAILSKHDFSMAVGGAIEEQYSFGMRILDHEKIVSCKGNLNSHESLFKAICKYYGYNSNYVDILIPKSAVKVGGKDLMIGEIIDISDHIRFVSYRTEKVQSYGRITAVGACTLGKYAQVVCSMIGKFSNVDKIADLCSRVIEGDLSAYAKAVKAGMNSSVMAEVAAIALPIWKDDKWQLIKTKEHMDQLYSRVASIHQKQVRKVKLKGAINRRAYWSPAIEQANEDNHTGCYIVKVRKGTVEMPMSIWVDKTLGDFDGDDAVLLQIAKGVYIIFRNPVNGPSSMFVGIDKGKASVQDVPEWAMPLVKYHKVSKAVPEPPKGDAVVADTLKGRVNQYIETLINAWANAPLLGQATNNLYLQSILEVVNGCNPKAQTYADRAALIEFAIVKAIKSTLSADIKLSDLNKLCNFGAKVTPEHVSKLQLVGVMIDQINKMKLESIFPRPKLDAVTTKVWDVCSKYNYQCTYEQYMRDIIGNVNELVKDEKSNLVNTMPIIRSTSGYNPQSWIKQDDTDVLIASLICREICSNKSYYKMPVADMDEVRKVNVMYMIFTSKRTPSDEIVVKLEQYLTERLNHIRSNNIKADALVREKVAIAKVLLRRFMGVGDKCSLDNIIDGFKKGANIIMGVRDIFDTQLRSFAYTCIHAYVKGYIISTFSDEAARCSAMFETGRIVFGMNNGRAKSSRLFWQYFSTFSKENMAKISNLWMASQSRINVNQVMDDNPLSDDMMADLFDHAHHVTYDDVANCSPVDLDCFVFDEGMDFDGFDDSFNECMLVEDDFDPLDI